MRNAVGVLLIATIASGCQPPVTSPAVMVPAGMTQAVPDDPDDPAVWIDAADSSRSLILGTNKVAAPGGALYVFGLDGRVKQVVGPLDRPNNVDVEYRFVGPHGTTDIAVVTERLQHRLRVYQVTADGLVTLDGGRGIPVLDRQAGEAGEPMGVALYRRPADGAIFAIVAPKTGAATQYLWQYRLETDRSSGAVTGTLVRRFGDFSGAGEIEAVAVDDDLGYVYYADEEFGVRKWHADPDHPDAGRELAVFGREGFKRQREGLAVLNTKDGGYIVASDQIPGASEIRLYPRGGRPGAPHVHDPVAVTIVTAADSTDGLEVVSAGLPDPFSEGLLVMMNSGQRNFLLYRWHDVAGLLAGRPVP